MQIYLLRWVLNLDTFGLAGDDTSKRLRQEIESMYYGLELPTRATKFSAGFDIRTK